MSKDVCVCQNCKGGCRDVSFFIMMACACQDTKTGKNLDVVASNVRRPYCCIYLIGDMSEYWCDKQVLEHGDGARPTRRTLSFRCTRLRDKI